LIVPERTLGSNLKNSEIGDLVGQYFAAHKLKAVVVTQGVRGSLLYERDHAAQRIPTEKVDAVDTNGAGDVFAGAFTWSVVRGLDLVSASLMATHCAAVMCQWIGNDGIRHLESRDVVQSWE
jgi:sugar/nucleoside kinase (ribokinase family)